MKIVTVPVLKDNFSYIIIDEESKTAVVVDPAEAEKVSKAVKEAGISKLEAVLTTHHHGDHAGGNKEMTQLYNGIKIYGGDDRVEAITDKVSGGHSIKIGSIEITVHFTPCHTAGHVLYEARDTKDPKAPHALFTGDTLFIAGCGRFFEGTAEQMYHALLEVVASLPGETQVYCGHEYTVKNLQFAKTLEPDNKAVLEKLEWAEKQRANNIPTVPSTVSEELTFNPFMRVKEKTVAKAVGLADASPIEVMKEVRARKDKF